MRHHPVFRTSACVAAASAVAIGAIVACASPVSSSSGQAPYSVPHTTACSTGPAHAPDDVPYEEKPDDDALPSCVPRCGAEQTYRDLRIEEYAVDALPSGACPAEGERCKMAAGSTQACPGEPTRVCNLSAYECRCEHGAWACVVVSQGAGVCGPCVDGEAGADSEVEASPTATPTFTPPSGTFADHVCVAIASTTPGATIHFTTDGSTPSVDSEVYTAPLPLLASTVVRALAVAPDHATSGLASAQIEIQEHVSDTFAPVSFAPSAGSYDHALDVTLGPDSTVVASAICFTTDGTTPSCAPAARVCDADGGVVLSKPAGGWCAPGSSLFTAPIHVEPPGNGDAAVLKAIACTVGHTDVTTSTYVFTP